MIKPKIGLCQDCPKNSKEKHLISGRCQTHYWQYRAKLKKNKVYKNKSKEPSKNTFCLDFASSKSLNEWFSYQISQSSWVCENCKTPINSSTNISKISAQAHILPKSIFKSVKLLHINRLELGHTECSCHQKYDLSWHSASKMNIFEKASEIIKQLIPLLSEEEYRKLPDIFKQNNINN